VYQAVGLLHRKNSETQLQRSRDPIAEERVVDRPDTPVVESRGNELFKQKRYKEAKVSFEDALKSKPDDVYATNKLKEIETLIK
jgi:uncharacterized protein HemY